MEELGRLPPLAWLLIAAAGVLGFLLFWVWSWYRRYRARKALHAAVTGAAADHLRESLVPDGMGGSFHIDFLLLTLACLSMPVRIDRVVISDGLLGNLIGVH